MNLDLTSKYILEMNKNGRSFLIIEHDMNFVMDVADKIYVLVSGEILAVGSPEIIKNDDKVLEAYLGGAK